MIRDFQIYGHDVVSFDTTYRTNKEYRPLALFVGLNNHREMVVFGATLLYEETTEAFEWLFTVFCRAMSANKPQTFITDQDPAICLTVSLFFKHFQRAVDDKRANENKSNFDMTQRIPILKVKLPLLIHAREIYIATIFDLFEKEWEKSLLVSINGFHEEGEFCKYNVSTHGSRREHLVAVKCSTKVVSCSCKFFEFSGVLCGHAIKILDTLNVKDKIPNHYILKRWTKDVTNLVAMEIKMFTERSDPKVEVSTRYRHLCQTLVQIASEASESREGYELVAEYSNEIIAKLKEVKIKNESHESPPVLSKDLHDETIFVDSANVTKVTGLKKK
ncbi:protein FAR1-RELATED SEQUENCE 7-like [Nicotiana tabacum]|uniref:Protein FAR1-RELATED SEQUENCE 7-like n=1 Tax=Nicotiana tabacum TaxID=4097 RepID=A0AC58TPU7_TOBAC